MHVHLRLLYSSLYLPLINFLVWGTTPPGWHTVTLNSIIVSVSDCFCALLASCLYVPLFLLQLFLEFVATIFLGVLLDLLVVICLPPQGNLPILVLFESYWVTCYLVHDLMMLIIDLVEGCLYCHSIAPLISNVPHLMAPFHIWMNEGGEIKHY